MHRDFRALLDDARGVSEFVIAVNVDIRGFSDWSLTVDSAQTALFIKKVYAKLIDRYFSDAQFVKPTGDGLLVVIGFEEDQLNAVATKLVRDATKIVESFGDLCADEEIINFPVPKEVGIGIARGAASRLTSGGKTLDYSGRVLNLASRLMDLARPHGVVFDADFGPKLLPARLRTRFHAQEVYLKGVSPTIATTVYCWPEEIEIPVFHRHPIGDKKWEQRTATITPAELEQLGVEPDDTLSYDLVPLPGAMPELFCIVSHDSVTSGGRKSKKYTTSDEFPVALVQKGAAYEAQVDRPALLNYLKDVGVGRKWEVQIELNYRSL